MVRLIQGAGYGNEMVNDHYLREQRVCMGLGSEPTNIEFNQEDWKRAAHNVERDDPDGSNSRAILKAIRLDFAASGVKAEKFSDVVNFH